MQPAFLKLPMAKKIWQENFASVALALFSSVLLLALFSMYLGQKNLRQENLYRAEALASHLAASLNNNDSQALEAIILKESSSPGLSSISVYDKNARPLVAWNALSQFETGNALPESELIAHTQSKLQITQLSVSTPVLYQAEIVGKIQISTSLRSLYLQTLLILLSGLLAGTAISLACSRHLTLVQLYRLAPLADLAETSHQVATLNDYSLRTTQHDGHELNHLNQHFNQIMEGIQHWESDRQSEQRERQEAERRLDILSNHDGLTKLPNRKYFHHLLTQCVADARENGELAALMFIDLDHFKSFNEQFGYDAGDLILATIANRLSGVLRNTDTLCRVDGDEFAAILPQIESKEMALALAERLSYAINRPMTLRGKRIAVSGSIGIACCPLDASEQRVLLRNTDLALKQAKAALKHKYVCYSGHTPVLTSVA
jgi:diguanylate cyclase (GGDEF)-like protein